MKLDEGETKTLLLNRLNVISVDSTGKLYNSYLGSSFENGTDKSEFIIGTTYHNINIGDQTLIDLSNLFKVVLSKEKLVLVITSRIISLAITCNMSSSLLLLVKISLDAKQLWESSKLAIKRLHSRYLHRMATS